MRGHVTHGGTATKARLTGWRAALARACALLLIIATLLPAAALARGPAGEPGIVLCTAEGVVHVPASALGLDEPSGPKRVPASHAGDHCPICRIAGSAPALLPPAVAILDGSILLGRVDFARVEAAPSARALPRGSLVPRAPPLSV